MSLSLVFGPTLGNARKSWIPDSLSAELGFEFRIPIVKRILDSLSWIADSKAKDSDFLKKIIGSGNPDYLGVHYLRQSALGELARRLYMGGTSCFREKI